MPSSPVSRMREVAQSYARVSDVLRVGLETAISVLISREITRGFLRPSFVPQACHPERSEGPLAIPPPVHCHSQPLQRWNLLFAPMAPTANLHLSFRATPRNLLLAPKAQHMRSPARKGWVSDKKSGSAESAALPSGHFAHSPTANALSVSWPGRAKMMTPQPGAP